MVHTNRTHERVRVLVGDQSIDAVVALREVVDLRDGRPHRMGTLWTRDLPLGGRVLSGAPALGELVVITFSDGASEGIRFHERNLPPGLFIGRFYVDRNWRP